MKRILLNVFILALCLGGVKAQTTTIAGDYKVIDIGNNNQGDYTRSVILLHEMYNGTVLGHNYAVGTITAMRGTAASINRMGVVNVNTSSSYSVTTGGIDCYDDNVYGTVWRLRTCMYAGKKYMAVEVPYGAAYHDWGFKFSGATTSTGESMKCVSYEQNGVPLNQNLISDIQDYTSTMTETHTAANFNISGNVGIGVSNTRGDKLAVKGNIHAQQVTVDMSNWADYVFKDDYRLIPLAEVKAYVDANGHLPEVPSEKEVGEKGLNLGEMNKLLLKKVEELTLYLIEKDRELRVQADRLDKVERKLESSKRNKAD